MYTLPVMNIIMFGQNEYFFQFCADQSERVLAVEISIIFFGLWPPEHMFSVWPGARNSYCSHGRGPTIYTQPRGASSISNLGLVTTFEV